METYNENTLSPLECFGWIEKGVFGYIEQNYLLPEADYALFKEIYPSTFAENFKKVQHLIENELDEGNIRFAVLVASVFECFLTLSIPEDKSLELTDSCINQPMYPLIVEGTRAVLDTAENPFATIVSIAKQREEHYFGGSFDFERLIDTDFGYVLHIKKCLFHEVLTVLGRNEVQYICCKMDLGWIDGIIPDQHGVQFALPTTFATGHTCQMWFSLREKDNQRVERNNQRVESRE